MSARIVVADDEIDILRLISFTLRKRGYTVLEASAGDIALQLIRDELPDLVVLDIMMPGLTGIEVAEALAGDPATRAIPILMLSAKGQAAEIQQGLASGASVYMVKPFNNRELAEAVARLLAGERPEPSPPAE